MNHALLQLQGKVVQQVFFRALEWHTAKWRTQRLRSQPR